MLAFLHRNYRQQESQQPNGLNFKVLNISAGVLAIISGRWG
jgi:hypothetical protein